jgi:hypothetical protein
MPANLEIGFFVFGAVLILIGLVGGHFKIFISNIPGVSNPFLRLVAFILGIAFVTLAIYPGRIAGAAAEPTNTALPVEPTNLQPSPQPVPPSPQPTQASPQPTSTDTPVPAKPSPTGFVTSYWQNVSDGKFESAWVQLSPRFRQVMHNGDYYDYVRGYQEMNLCRIVVSNINLVQQDNYSAVVIAHFNYYTGGQCSSSEYDFEMWLIYDGMTNSYLFDKNILK